MTGLQVGGHGDGAGGGDVAIEVLVRLPRPAELAARWHAQVVRIPATRRLQGRGDGLLSPHPWQLECDLLLIDGQGPDASLLRESSLVLQPTPAEQV